MRYALAALAFACGTDKPPADNDPFATFQDCFDEHHHVESFDAQDAIEVCCLSHPIGDQLMNVVCGSTATDCETYVDANLSDPDATTAVVNAACDKYVVDRNG